MKKTTSVADLEKVLTHELELYEKYRTALEADMDLMAKLDIDSLESSNKSKATLLLKIQTLDEVRSQIIATIAEQKGITAERVRITDICQKVTAEEGKRLQTLREQLQTCLTKIKDIQERAHSVVQSSSGWIEGSMATLRRILSPAGTYNARGRVGEDSNFAGRVVENKA